MQDTGNGFNLAAAGMADAAGSIIMPSAQPKGQLQIANGMGIGRYAFFLEITTKSIGGDRREIVTGFTSYDGVSRQSGAIDHQMQFHVNSRIEIADSVYTDATGTHRMSTVIDDSQVLAEIPTAPEACAMRPEDVVMQGQKMALMDGAQGDIVDIRTTLKGAASLSDRKNVMPAHYLSTVCKGYMGAAREHGGDDFGRDGGEFYKDAVMAVKAPSLLKSAFCRHMGFGNTSNTHRFTYAQLQEAWPRPDSFFMVSMPKPGQTLTSPLQNTEHWQGANIETTIAFSLTHALPALMSRLMMLSVEVDITNQTLDGMPKIAIMKCVGMFDGVITPHHIKHLEGQLELDIIRGILNGKAGHFHIHMNINLLSSSQFNISVNGGESIPYNAPMFCDSYYSPVIGMNQGQLGAINVEVEALVGQMAGATAEVWTPTTTVPGGGGSSNGPAAAPDRVTGAFAAQDNSLLRQQHVAGSAPIASAPSRR